MMFVWVLFLSVCVSGLLLLIGFVLSVSGEVNYDKMSPFECGFNPNTSYRSMFSLQFFVISLIFLVFDLELVILFPYLLANSGAMGLEIYLSCSLFVSVLLGGLLYEWNGKNLEWCD